MYDPQIGRFGQIDPYADVFFGWSPYTFSSNDPTLLNDPDGLLSDSAHPQELAPVVVTPQKKSSTIIIDSRPSKANPDFEFGTNTPFYVHYNQTDPGQWNPQITTEFATSLKISAALIPAGRGLKLTYEAYKILQRIRSLKNIPESAERAAEAARNGVSRPGYKGGGRFKNDGRSGDQVLPKTDANGNPIDYKEYDVNPRVPGQGRGTERVVYGSDGKAYYTDDHYHTFTEIKP